jgi:hypothetical protein
MNSNEHSILLAIHNAYRPLTVKEISQRTRIPVASVYRICAESQKVLNVGGRPVQFYAKQYDELDANHILVDREKPLEGWLEWIDNANWSIPDLLKVDTNDTKERKHRADALRALGVMFLSLSNDLREGLGRPDWRDLLTNGN